MDDAIISNVDQHRRWSDLPAAFLSLLRECLIFADAVRFAAVCKSWQSAALESRHFQALRLPWQVQISLETSRSSNELHFFSPAERRLHRLNLSASNLNVIGIHGFSKGWLIMYHSGGGNLLKNLFTGTKFSLPRNAIEIFGCKSVKQILDPNSIAKAVLSTHPSPCNLANRDCVVVAILKTYDVVFCLPGDEVWTVLYRGKFEDVIFFQGLLYCVKEDGEITVVEFSPQPRWMIDYNDIADDIDADNHWFVESGDELLVVVKYSIIVGINEDLDDEEAVVDDEKEGSERIRDTDHFDVYVLDKNMPGWRKKMSLGDRMLILGEGYCISAVAATFLRFGFRSNCIYFRDGQAADDKWREFCIDDGKIEWFPWADHYFKNCPQFWFNFNA